MTNATLTTADLTPIRHAGINSYVKLPNGQLMLSVKHARTVELLLGQREDIVDDLARLGRTPIGDARVTDRIRSLQSIARSLANLGCVNV